MTKKEHCSIILVFFLQLILNGHGERTKDKMYEKILGSSGCYRRLNSTHQIGCSSKRGGSTGVVHYCDTDEDLDFILKNGTAGPYIPIIPTQILTLETINSLKTSGKVSGLVIYKEQEKPNDFTHDKQCPNEKYSVEGTCEKNSGTHLWNPHGSGLLYQDIPFPMFYVESENEVSKIKDCFQKFNNFSYETQRDRVLCSLELNSFMYATTNTPTCKRRSNIVTNLNPVKFCDPLGDSNVWASLFPLSVGPSRNDTKPVNDYEYIVVAARMDTTSLFDKTAGANSPVTGIVTLLSVAKLLNSMLPRNSNVKKNVLFLLFNGETYDYIGSQRLLYDMERGHFPVELPENNDILPLIYPQNISMFIELSQLGNSRDVFAHFLKENEKITEFYKRMIKSNDNLNIQIVPNSLPPASLHTFLNEYKNFPGIVISDHEASYVNNYYNSIYDNSSNIDFKYYNITEEDQHVKIPKDSIQQYIVNVSTMVAKSIYEEIMDGAAYSGNESLDIALVDELFHCYLEDPNCRVHRAVQKSKLPKVPVSLYVGVDVVSNYITTLAYYTLAWFTGDVVGEGNINCTNKPRNFAFRFFNMSKSIYELNNTLCYKATVNTTEAVSPAFIIDDYDWSTAKYSSWAESTWADMNMRIFLKPSSAHETMTIAIGSMSMIFSIVIVYFMKTRSHILFNAPLSADEPANC